MKERKHQRGDAIDKIREIVDAVSEGGEDACDEANDGTAEQAIPMKDIGCTLKVLPERLLVKAAKTARKINPVNAPGFAPHSGMAEEVRVSPVLRMAVSTAKYWGPTARQLTVNFMEKTPDDLRRRIISHMNAWTKTGCISFVDTSDTGDVRISRGTGGYYSYLGTDILHIPRNRQTMNLESFTMKTPESEYLRVVRHETGHTLGAPHEHMRKALVARIDPEKAYEYFWRTQRWDRSTVDAQVLTPLDELSLLCTPPDQDSIMCYQLPGSITRDGSPIRGGTDINQSDFEFIGRIYPKATPALASKAPIADDEWPESEDVDVSL